MTTECEFYMQNKYQFVNESLQFFGRNNMSPYSAFVSQFDCMEINQNTFKSSVKEHADVNNVRRRLYSVSKSETETDGYMEDEDLTKLLENFAEMMNRCVKIVQPTNSASSNECYIDNMEHLNKVLSADDMFNDLQEDVLSLEEDWNANKNNFFTFMGETEISETPIKTRYTKWSNADDSEEQSATDKQMSPDNTSIKVCAFNEAPVLPQNTILKPNQAPTYINLYSPELRKPREVLQHKTTRFCAFCYKNGEQQSIYEGHSLKNPQGNVTCPILSQYTCQICGATGDLAHTRRHCPFKFKDVQYLLFQ